MLQSSKTSNVHCKEPLLDVHGASKILSSQSHWLQSLLNNHCKTTERSQKRCLNIPNECQKPHLICHLCADSLLQIGSDGGLQRHQVVFAKAKVNPPSPSHTCRYAGHWSIWFMHNRTCGQKPAVKCQWLPIYNNHRKPSLAWNHKDLQTQKQNRNAPRIKPLPQKISLAQKK